MSQGRGKRATRTGRSGPSAGPSAGADAAPAGQAAPTPASSDAEAAVRVIKKYPNRRLYDTQGSAYITLSDVKQMVMAHEAFEVRDAKTQEDITRSILLQIILEEESGGVPMFSTPMLAHIIRVYGHAMQGLMGSYLERNVQAFMDMQAQLAEQGMKSFATVAPTPPLGPQGWADVMNMQSPAMQGMLNTYLEQSKTAFLRMQEQMQAQADQMLGAFGVRHPPGKDR